MIQCLVCKREFKPKRRVQKYCCNKCAANSCHRKMRGLSIENLELNCSVCGIKFVQVRANNTEYCSFGCKRLGVSRKFAGNPVFGPRKHIKGSGHITSQGYKTVSANHPRAKQRGIKSGKGQILEHILIMEKKIGRYLRDDESVHHKNGVRSDNREENLELWSKTTHGQHQRFGQRLHEKIYSFIEFLESYGCKVELNEFVKNMQRE